jgi:nitroreductase
MLRAPGPDRAALATLLAAAVRSPDHGMLAPWRFVVLAGAALPRLGEHAGARAMALGLDAVGVAKARTIFADAPLVIAVVGSPKASAKIPALEQTLSAGAVCLALLNAALAAGWGAAWITGSMASDRPFLDALGLAPAEWVAGFIHVGTPGPAPAPRERPDPAALTTWVER